MLLVVPLFPTSILEANLNMLVLPLFLTLIPEAAHKLLVLLMLEADLKQLVLPLVLSEASMLDVLVLNTGSPEMMFKPRGYMTDPWP